MILWIELSLHIQTYCLKDAVEEADVLMQVCNMISLRVEEVMILKQLHHYQHCLNSEADNITFLHQNVRYTDAIARLKIQYGLSFVYPSQCIGSHVSV